MAKFPERAKFVKNEREKRAWPQRQLAQAARISLRTIQRIEFDGSASFETLMAIAGAFGVEVSALGPKGARRKKQTGDKEVHLLPRITSGSDLASIVQGADRFQIEHDQSEDPRVQKAMVEITRALKRDVVRLYDADIDERLEIEFELSAEIQGLERYGFYLFGIKREIPLLSQGKGSKVALCTVLMSHSQSRKIVKDKNANMIVPARLTESL